MLYPNIHIGVLIHSVYRSHQTPDSKTFRARRKIEIQMSGHNILLTFRPVMLTIVDEPHC